MGDHRVKSNDRSDRCSWILLIAASLAAFVLRVYTLGVPLLRWDEGWTIAHGQLPWPDLIRIAALEWHPPLFYLLYKFWQPLAGLSTYAVRYPAVLAGVLTVALTYVAALAWTSNRNIAHIAACCNAALPLLVYYGQVNRMYAWTAVGVLLATWALLRAARERWSWPAAVWSGATTATALYLLYYTVWPLLALYLYALLIHRRAWRTILLSGGVAVLLFAPWLVYAAGTLQTRIQPGLLNNALRQMRELMGPSVFGLVFAYGRGWTAVWMVGGLLLLGLLLAPSRQRVFLLLPLLGIGLSTVGVSYGAQAVRFFAVRHFVPVAPFLGMGIAWALGQLYERKWWLLVFAGVILAVTFWPVRTAVYAKMLEVVDPFDPTEDWRYLAPHLWSDDLVFFNNLARAGWYEQSRGGQGAPWSYALRWDPIVEPMPVITARVEAAMEKHPRLWFVLYKGTIGPNNDLRGWLSAHPRLYPMWEGWVGDSLVLGYVVPHEPLRGTSIGGEFADGQVELVRARFTPIVRSGMAVELDWRIKEAPSAPLKVFVHLMSEDGQLVAQHDAPLPNAASSPAGTVIQDRHGVGIPPGISGPFTVRVGLYAEDTGERLKLKGGGEFIVLGQVEVTH